MGRDDRSKFFIFIFLMFLISMSFVSAQPPFQNIGQAGESRYIIEFPKIETAAYLHDFNFYAHVYFSNGTAITNGLTNETVTCHLHGYNQSGVETYDKIMNYSDDDWTAYVPASFFNWIGEGYYVVWCMDDMNISGAASNPFAITTNGTLYSETSTIVVYALIALAFIFLALSFFFKDEYWMLKSLFHFLSVGAGLIAVNSAKIIANQSNIIDKMGSVGITIMIVVLLIFFLIMFVYSFLEIISIFKEKKGVRWNYD